MVLAVALLAAGLVTAALRFGPGELVAFSVVSAVGAVGALLGGPRLRPAVLGLLFAVTVGFRAWLGSASLSVGVVFGLSNVVEVALFASLAARRERRLPRLDRERTVLQFLAVSVLGAALGGLVLAVGLSALGTQGPSLAATWFIRTGADTVGLLLIVPLLLVRDLWPGSGRQWAAMTAAVALLAAVSHAGFVGQIFFYPFMPLALLFFLVLRLGRRGAAVLPPVIVVASVWHTMLGDGPFAQGTFTTSLGPVFVVQTYDLVAVAGAWLLAAVLAERQAAIAALEESRRGLETRVRERTATLAFERHQAQTVVGAIQDGLVLFDADLRVTHVNEAFCRLTGFVSSDLLGCRPPLPWWRPQDAAVVLADLAAHRTIPTPEYERVILGRDGNPIEVIAQAAPLLGPDGQLHGLVSTFKDVRDRARRERSEQRGRARAEALATVSGVLAAAGRSEEAVLDALARAVSDTIAQFCVVGLTNAGGLRPAAASPRDPELSRLLCPAHGGEGTRPGEGQCGAVLFSGTPVLHGMGDTRFRAAIGPAAVAQLGRLGVTSLGCVPLRVGPEVIGAMALGRGQDGDPLDGDDLALIAEVADRAGLAIENARLYARQLESQQELARSAQRATVLAGVSQALAAADPEPDAVCDTAARLLVRDVGDTCVIMLASPGTPELRLATVRSRTPDAATLYQSLYAARPRRIDDSGPLARVFATGKPVLVPEVEPADYDAILPAELLTYMHRYGASSLAYLPLRTGAGIVGVLAISRFPARSDPFAPSDITLLRDLADRIAVPLERARIAAALRDSEEQFRSAFESTPIGAVMANLGAPLSGQIVKANPAFCEITGYSEDQLRGMSIHDVTHPDDRAADEAIRVDLVGGHRHIFEREKRYVRADGQVRWVRVKGSIIPIAGERHTIAHVEDITERKHAEAELAFRAWHDPLTGLPNRHLFMDHLRLALGQIDRQPGLVALCYLDLDHFKEINDGMGHEAGDRVLAEVGRRLVGAVRSVDTVARLAGDEFAIVCPQLDHGHNAAFIAERVRAALAEPVILDGAPVDIGASIGVSVTGSAAADPEELLRRADIAMYQAKRRGRQRWVIFSEAVQNHAAHRLAVQQDLRAALDQHRFRLHYQPIVDLDAGAIVAVEALLRLDHPKDGLLAPTSFIEIAEDSDLIIPIGEWALIEACRQAAEWNANFGPLGISVNVAGRQATHLTVTDQVTRATEAAHLDPSLLCLEMTERVLIEAGDSIVADLARLTDRGVRLALDDFGTGYSSLTYLRRLPVHAVKIDRSFVAGLGGGSRDTAIVEAVTALAGTLDLDVIAEGVETQKQRDILWTLGCRRAQGFHFARPQSAEDITGLLRAGRRNRPSADLSGYQA